MKTSRLPANWAALFAGDQIHTRLPFHRMQDIQASMLSMGYIFEFTPSGAGYIVECTASPNKVPAPAGAA